MIEDIHRLMAAFCCWLNADAERIFAFVYFTSYYLCFRRSINLLDVFYVDAAFVVFVFFVLEILCCWITRESLAFTFCVVVNRNNFGVDIRMINPAVA